MPENMAYNVFAWTQGYEWDFEILSEEHTEKHGNKLCAIMLYHPSQIHLMGFAQINIFELMLQIDFF